MDRIVKDLSGPPNNWDQETIQENMFETYSVDQIRGTSYDPKSIAHYFYPATWVKTGKALLGNQNLSNQDKIALNLEYPRQTSVPKALEDPYAMSTNQSKVQSHQQLVGPVVIGKPMASANTTAAFPTTCESTSLWKDPVVLTFLVLGMLVIISIAVLVLYKTFRNTRRSS
jgi:hypothetical protein